MNQPGHRQPTEAEAVRRAYAALEERAKLSAEVQRLVGEVALAASCAATLEEVLYTALRSICEFNGWDVGHAFLIGKLGGDVIVPTGIWYSSSDVDYRDFRDATMKMTFSGGEGLIGRVIATGEALWVEDVTRTAGWKQRGADMPLGAACMVPIMTGERVVGVLEFYSSRPMREEASLKEGLWEIGLHLGHVFERLALEREVVELAEKEQRRIGAELHDDLGQRITGAAMLVGSLAETLQQKDLAEEARLAREVAAVLNLARGHVAALVRRLIPRELEGGGLANALEILAARVSAVHKIECRVEADDALSVEDASRATNIYRIAQEATHNAIRHGNATRVTLLLWRDPVPGRARLEIRDNGSGLPPGGVPSEGMGMRIMRYRAGLADGRLEIGTSETGGVTVTVRFPLGGVGRRGHARSGRGSSDELPDPS